MLQKEDEKMFGATTSDNSEKRAFERHEYLRNAILESEESKNCDRLKQNRV